MRSPETRLYEDEAVVDCFAGAGGASEGITEFLGRSPDVAIDHNAIALGVHEENHPTTKHIRADIREVDPRKALGSRKCGFAWFSPDCTYHSKARGGKPHRDKHHARKMRGLPGVVIRWAASVKPRVIVVENVEEFEDWGPLIWGRTKRGEGYIPDPARRGQSFQRWVSRLRNLGYEVEWRQLLAADYGAPTARNRLFIIARCDGRPIRWPAKTHGKGRAKPHRSAAEGIDFSLPMPSIFLTPAEALAWGKAHGLPAPKRPLSDNTLARVARGFMKYVAQASDPFIVNVRHDDRTGRVHSIRDPLPTITASDREFSLIAPTLIQTSYGERKGQRPRILDIREPLGTVVAGGIKHSLVAAFLAKHNAGHEATGQRLTEPLHTATVKDTKALVAAFLTKLRGWTPAHIDSRSSPMTDPVETISAQGNHAAIVCAFLVKYYGSAEHGQSLFDPIGTVTTNDRFGLVTVTIAGEEYVVVDIAMRMLWPFELARCTGFRRDYVIDRVRGRPIPKKTQTKLIGNAVPPAFARAIAEANMVVSAATEPSPTSPTSRSSWRSA